MRCRKVRALLFTEYVDGECAPGTVKKIKGHLKECENCAQLYKRIKYRAVVPLKGLERPSLPEGLWSKIESSIDHSGSLTTGRNFFSAFLSLFIPIRKPAAVLIVTIGMLIVLFSGKFQQEDHEREISRFIVDQIGFLYSLAYDDGMEIDNIGIPLEIA